EEKQRCRNRGPAGAGAVSPESLKFPRQLGIARLMVIEIYHTDLHSMLHLAFPELVKERTPARILFQVVGHMFGKKNVTGVASVHDALGNVDASSSDIR